MEDDRQGFWRELFSRSNAFVSTMAFIALIISAPVVAVSLVSLVYDIFYLGNGLKGNDAAVRLLLGLITASTGGLAVSQFAKRTAVEMMGRGFAGGGEGDGLPPYVPPGPTRPPAKVAPGG